LIVSVLPTLVPKEIEDGAEGTPGAIAVTAVVNVPSPVELTAKNV
jgi:hypothetical protein